MEVVAAESDAGCALARVQDVRPDVILLEMELGAKSAVEILPELVSKSNAKVLILTGARNRETVDQSILLGARGVVYKEEAPEVLITAIEKVHSGEIWLDRDSTARILGSISSKQNGAGNGSDGLGSLTTKERKVVEAVIRDITAPNKLIAKGLFISDSTLRNHLTSIYHKLNIDNRMGLYLYATNQKRERGFSSRT